MSHRYLVSDLVSIPVSRVREVSVVAPVVPHPMFVYPTVDTVETSATLPSTPRRQGCWVNPQSVRPPGSRSTSSGPYSVWEDRSVSPLWDVVLVVGSLTTPKPVSTFVTNFTSSTVTATEEQDGSPPRVWSLEGRREVGVCGPVDKHYVSFR